MIHRSKIEPKTPAPHVGVQRRVMRTWLLTWNPEYADVTEEARMVAEQGAWESDWSTQARRIVEGDALYLMRQGSEPRGLVAAGYASGAPTPYDDGRWYVPLVWTRFAPEAPFVSLRELRTAWPTQCWSPQCSGIQIKPPVDEMLNGRQYA